MPRKSGPRGLPSSQSSLEYFAGAGCSKNPLSFGYGQRRSLCSSSPSLRCVLENPTSAGVNSRFCLRRRVSVNPLYFVYRHDRSLRRRSPSERFLVKLLCFGYGHDCSLYLCLSDRFLVNRRSFCPLGMVTFVRLLMNPSSFGCCYDRSLCRRNTSDGVLIHPLFFGHGQGLFYCRSSFAGFYLSVYCSFFFLLSVFLLSVYLAIKFSYVGQVKHVRTRVSRRNELLQSAIVFL